MKTGKNLAMVLGILLLLSLSTAGATESTLVNGLAGAYWGLSVQELQAKVQGKALATKKMGSMLGLVYQTQAGGLAVKTTYTLQDDACWKMMIQVEATKSADAVVIRQIFGEAVAEISRKLGPPENKWEENSPMQLISWSGEHTSALVDFETGTPEKTSLMISFESPTLTEKIWGKAAKH